MPDINGSVLAMAIQAVDFKIADLERQIEELSSDKGSELELLLLNYENTANALKHAYLEALSEVDNLPPYEKLVRVTN